MKLLWLKEYRRTHWRRRTFILPTKFGFFFGGAAFLMLAIALSYANNLVFFVCFFLTSFGIVALYMTNRNVKNFAIDAVHVTPFFADSRGEIQVTVKPLGHQILYNIKMKLFNLVTLIEYIPAKSDLLVALPLPCAQRGWNELPPLQIESDFPFRMCRSWKKINIDRKFMVYPARFGTRSFPLQGEEPGKQSQNKKLQGENFQGHKIYTIFDSVRRIDWKASARSQKTLIKNFDESSADSVIFHWKHTEALRDTESRLSQLALWIDVAEQKHVNYQLILPFWKSSVGKGPTHWDSCLQTLALWKSENVST